MIDDLANIIRKHQKTLPNVEPLDVDDEFEQVYKDTEDGNLSIKNEMFSCTGLRKVHLEIASLGKLDILHCIWYPDPEFNLPIFGADIVANNNISVLLSQTSLLSMVSDTQSMMRLQISADIMDLSTVETSHNGVKFSLLTVSLPDWKMMKIERIFAMLLTNI